MIKNFVKWSLLVAGSTIAALNIGSCIAQMILQSIILRSVN